MNATVRQRGFTLIELAVVIAIIGLMLGAILTPLSTQLSLRKNREAESRLQASSEALVGFALANGRLPCPDTDRDGVENPPGGATPGPPLVVNCTSPTGFIPWATLDTEPLDPWGRIVLYRVSAPYTFPVATGQPAAANQLSIDDVGDGNVQLRDLDTKAATNLTQQAPVMLLSTGANGSGGTYLDGTAVAGPAAGTDEAENLDGDAVVVRRIRTVPAAGCDDQAAGSAPCEFDDVVAWISGPRLIGMMVQAGQLP